MESDSDATYCATSDTDSSTALFNALHDKMEDGEITDAAGDAAPAETKNLNMKDADVDSDIASSGPRSPTVYEQESTLAPTSPHTQSTQKTPEKKQTMTAEQMHQAKIIVLDLLGWGVPPEYILGRGVSHELLCTVFSELNLRLPESILAEYATIKNRVKDS